MSQLAKPYLIFLLFLIIHIQPVAAQTREEAVAHVFLDFDRVIPEKEWTEQTWHLAAMLLADPFTDDRRKSRILGAVTTFKTGSWSPEFLAAYQEFLQTAEKQYATVEKYRSAALGARKVQSYRIALFSQGVWTDETWEKLGDVRLGQIPTPNEIDFPGYRPSRSIFGKLKYYVGPKDWSIGVRKFLSEIAPVKSGPGTEIFAESISATPLPDTKLRDLNPEAVWKIVEEDLANDDFKSLARHLPQWRNVPDKYRQELIERLAKPFEPRNRSLIQYAFYFQNLLGDDRILRVFEKALKHFIDRGDQRNLLQLLHDPAARDIVAVHWVMLDKISRQGYAYNGRKLLSDAMIETLKKLEAVWTRDMTSDDYQKKIGPVITPLEISSLVPPERVTRALDALVKRQVHLQPARPSCEGLFRAI